MTAVMEPEVITYENTETEDGDCAHIVRTEPGESAAAKILEARVLGIAIEALCGYTWVPQKNPEGKPVCSKCKEIYDMHRQFNDDLSETPRI